MPRLVHDHFSNPYLTMSFRFHRSPSLRKCGIHESLTTNLNTRKIHKQRNFYQNSSIVIHTGVLVVFLMHFGKVMIKKCKLSRKKIKTISLKHKRHLPVETVNNETSYKDGRSQ